MFDKVLPFLIEAVTNKYFWFGFITAIVLFSHYIFGNDNAIEQLNELVLKIFTGIDHDFSPQP